ncbi:MAG: hypothetical protein HY821_12885 [Acidobacteria bacterium]|nr:hypothetical protein [Acidobacteriota bacterium]
MASSTSHPIEEKLVRHYSDRKEADIVLKVRYTREVAGDATLVRLESSDELTD